MTIDGLRYTFASTFYLHAYTTYVLVGNAGNYNSLDIELRKNGVTVGGAQDDDLVSARYFAPGGLFDDYHEPCSDGFQVTLSSLGEVGQPVTGSFAGTLCSPSAAIHNIFNSAFYVIRSPDKID